jgi:thiamine biosynthesis protein ThiI
MPRRSVKDESFTSQDLGRICGDAVYHAVEDRHPRVDLKNPDHAIHVELREKQSYIFTEIVKGVGGMPLGSQGAMVALVSGGIDSPVAAWLMMKRGCTIIPLYMDNAPYLGEDAKARTLETVRKLKEWAPGHPMKMLIAPHGKNLATFIGKGNKKYTSRRRPLQRGYPHRRQDPQSSSRSDAGPDYDLHFSPRLHRAQCRPDRGAARRPHR